MLWEAARVLDGHGGAVLSCAWSPDGQKIATASVDQTVRIHLLDTSDVSADARGHVELEGHTEPVWNATWSKNGDILATAAFDKAVRLWKGAENKTVAHAPVCAPLSVAAEITTFALSPDSTAIAIASESMMQLWHIADGGGSPERPPAPYARMQHLDLIRDVCWSGDSQSIATCSDDRTVKQWTRDGVLLCTHHGHTRIVSCVQLSRDVCRLVCRFACNHASIYV